jgi:hypothetical protein
MEKPDDADKPSYSSGAAERMNWRSGVVGRVECLGLPWLQPPSFKKRESEFEM